jgi:hypothetical protein
MPLKRRASVSPNNHRDIIEACHVVLELLYTDVSSCPLPEARSTNQQALGGNLRRV